jgi:hypothetical protein
VPLEGAIHVAAYLRSMRQSFTRHPDWHANTSRSLHESKNICKHVDDCLQRTSGSNKEDAERIRGCENARWQDGGVGAESCARGLGKKTAKGQLDAWLLRR